jgi:hypothetical protein
VHPAARAVARLEDDRALAGPHDLARGHQPGEPAADDHDVALAAADALGLAGLPLRGLRGRARGRGRPRADQRSSRQRHVAPVRAITCSR